MKLARRALFVFAACILFLSATGAGDPQFRWPEGKLLGAACLLPFLVHPLSVEVLSELKWFFGELPPEVAKALAARPIDYRRTNPPGMRNERRIPRQRSGRPRRTAPRPGLRFSFRRGWDSLRINHGVPDALPLPGIGHMHQAIAGLDHGRVRVLLRAGGPDLPDLDADPERPPRAVLVRHGGRLRASERVAQGQPARA